MIRLQQSMLEGLRGPAPDPDAVCDTLQSAIELEHATIPPYLYALYSLDPAKNAEIAAIIASVVVEEMLHLTLAANVLNALGGSPVIDAPGFVPTYPGHLPHSVQADLTVSLAPFSPDQLQTFLTIEEPADPLVFAQRAEDGEITIGEFYAAILDAIVALGDGAFVNPPRNQVGPDLMAESVVVVGVDTARQAIQTIVDQGEGTAVSPLEQVGQGYAHYYRYQQIAKGHLLMPTGGGPDPQDQYAYDGPAVPFDPSGVYAAPTDPGPYPSGSAQALANNNFNYTYTCLLKALHALLNGDATPARMDSAIGLMMSLKEQAKAMMSGIPNPAVITGPTFEYQPTNPGAGKAP